MWTAITIDDLRDREAAPMIHALQTAALADGQDDPVPELIQSALDSVRAAIATCPQNQLESDLSTIPPSLKDLTIRRIIRLAKGRLDLPATPEEIHDAKEDERTLRAISLCALAVEKPALPAPSPSYQRLGAVELVRSRQRLATRDQLDGLI